VLVPLDVALVAALLLVVFVGYGMLGNRWYHVIAIEGGSMEPTIARGDLIVVTPAPAAVQPGMILTLQVGRRVVTHRVVAVRPDGSFVTRGDANNTNDDWGSQPVRVYGQYAFRIPALGQFLPVSNASGASFADGTGASQKITVAHWTPTPTPDAAADGAP
jgi:signal peptidase